MNAFDWSQLISMAEAEKLYGRDKSTIKRAISSQKIREGIDCKKFGRDWVFVKDNIDLIYGVKEPKIMINELMNKEISKEVLLEGLKENGYEFDEKTIDEDIEKGYFYVRLEGYQDWDCVEVETVDEDILVARFQ